MDKRLTIDIDKDLHGKFKSKSASESLSMKELIINWIRRYLTRS